jgi:hypothetical protein
VVHEAALSALYLESSPHSAHDELPAGAYVPAAHDTTTLFPEHALPVGHCVHAFRCVLSMPPVVNDPAVQVLQVVAAAALNWSSSPQGAHSA